MGLAGALFFLPFTHLRHARRIISFYSSRYPRAMDHEGYEYHFPIADDYKPGVLARGEKGCVFAQGVNALLRGRRLSSPRSRWSIHLSSILSLVVRR